MFKLLGSILALQLVAGVAHAQSDYPTQPVTLVVGFAAGGGMDGIARLVSARVSEALGQQMVVENRAGASGTIAAAYVANARPDGYTLYLGETSALIGPVVQGNVGYDPQESFTPVAQLTTSPLALVANPDVPVTTMAEFIELIQGAPGEYFYASSGVGTLQHLAGEVLQEEAGIEIEEVQFQGGNPSVTAVLSGEVPFGIVSLGAAASQADAGGLNVIGVTMPQRLEEFPDYEAIGETIEGFSASPSQFLFAPAGTPDDVVQVLSAAVQEAMADPQLQERLGDQGFLPDYKDAATLGEEMPLLIERWTTVAQSADLGQ